MQHKSTAAKETAMQIHSREQKIKLTLVFMSLDIHSIEKCFNYKLQAIDDSRYTSFSYPRLYVSIMRGINILSAATVEAAAQAH
jgi:hypothetical protein